jgi:PAS domain S-box-containing protein
MDEKAARRSSKDMMRHEISVYQEELFLQNEALTQTQAALEETRDRFIELYDFAPSGYITLDQNGVICQCNLTAAAMIGRSKPALEGLPFLGFVAPEDRPTYMKFLRRCRRSRDSDSNSNSDSDSDSGREIQAELTMRTADGPRRVEILCRVRSGRDGTHEYFTALVDVTDKRHVEREREQIARERAALTSRLIAIQDDERLRIARNLHDDLGQQVTALRLKLEELQSAGTNGANGDAVEPILDMLHQLDRRVHFVAGELRPAALDLGIVTALGQFVREWSANVRVPAAFHSTGIVTGTLSPHVETHLYRITQEALNNAAKHAAAGQVTVMLEHRDDGLMLMIEDDGLGFDLEAARSRGQCLGLVGIRERAQIVGGRLEVETGPGNGTSIFVYVPHRAHT